MFSLFRTTRMKEFDLVIISQVDKKNSVIHSFNTIPGNSFL